LEIASKFNLEIINILATVAKEKISLFAEVIFSKMKQINL